MIAGLFFSSGILESLGEALHIPYRSLQATPKDPLKEPLRESLGKGTPASGYPKP